jgi:hypothetical protein
MEVDYFMARVQRASNLISHPFFSSQIKGSSINTIYDLFSISAVLCSISRFQSRLTRSVAALSRVALNFPRNRGLAATQIQGIVRNIESGFYKGRNLISLSLAEVFIGYGNLTFEVKKP